MTPALIPTAPTPVPPYTAGAGIPAPALNAAQAAGWDRHEGASANVTYTSPDGRCVLQFGPETDRYHDDADRLWIAEYRPESGQPHAWAAHFGDHVPAEAIAAFVTALTDPAGIRGSQPGYGAGAGGRGAEEVFAAAEAHGWTRAVRTATYTGSHGTMHLSYDPAPPVIPGQFLTDGPHWRVSYLPEDLARDWTVQLTAHVPGEAIAAFLTALMDSTGLDPHRA